MNERRQGFDMIDYDICTLDGKPAVELFDARTGTPLTFCILGPGVDARAAGRFMMREHEAGRLAPDALVAEVRA